MGGAGLCWSDELAMDSVGSYVERHEILDSWLDGL